MTNKRLCNSDREARFKKDFSLTNITKEKRDNEKKKVKKEKWSCEWTRGVQEF